MFKDYYKILKIDQSATFQEIKLAYRTMSMKWHPDRNPDQDVTIIMQNINEAYSILKDSDKRRRYDEEYDKFKQYSYSQYHKNNSSHNSQRNSTWEYDYDIQNNEVKEDIKNARDYAEKIVDEFMASFKHATHDAALGAWNGAKSYIWATIIFGVIGITAKLCTSINKQPHIDIGNNKLTENYQTSTDLLKVTHIDKQETKSPNKWTTYWIDNNSFSISIPPTMELRSSTDNYTKRLHDYGITVNTDNVIFQQKGLANSKVGTEDKHYCRVIIGHARCQPGDVYKFNETDLITNDLRSELLEMVSAEITSEQRFIRRPIIKWIDINGTKAIEIKYKRSGNNNNTTCCVMYLLFNYDELVKMIVAYREQESELWATDMNKVIKTFKWSNKK